MGLSHLEDWDQYLIASCKREDIDTQGVARDQNLRQTCSMQALPSLNLKGSVACLALWILASGPTKTFHVAGR